MLFHLDVFAVSVLPRNIFKKTKRASKFYLS